MPREYKEGVWITTRDSKAPDSQLHVERDDLLFSSFYPFFIGQTKIDFVAIAAKHSLEPVNIFLDLQENYGYICIGTGENPAKGERLSAEQIAQRKQTTQKALEAAHMPHILIKGKYMGVEEDSFFIPFNDKTIGLAAALQGEKVKQVINIAVNHNQDSVLICQGSIACYVYTSGPQKGRVITGNSTIVYPSVKELPSDCYSLFVDDNNIGIVGFTCALNFDITYSNIAQFAAKENHELRAYYKDFVTEPVTPPAKSQIKCKKIFITRGANGYNEYGLEVKAALEKSGLKVAIFSTDATLAKINEELADEKSELFKTAKSLKEESATKVTLFQEKLDAEKTELKKTGEEPKVEIDILWATIIRPEFIKRNNEIYESLIRSDYDVIIDCDMKKLAPFMEPRTESALQQGHDICCLVVNSFAFDPGRSDYSEKLCNQLNLSMSRHVQGFKSKEGQIYAKLVNVNGKEIKQYHDLTPAQVCALVPSPDQAAVSALNSGLVDTLLGKTKQFKEKSNEVAAAPSMSLKPATSDV